MNKMIIFVLSSLSMISLAQATPVDDLIKSGNTFWSQGKLELAETEFKKALEIDSESSAAHARVANLYLTQNKAEAASKEFQNAIVGDPENAKLFIGLAITYLHQNYHQMAEAMVVRAIELDPDMKNAQKLKTYMDAKKEVVASAPEAAKSMSAAHGESAVAPIMPAAHGGGMQTNSGMPATLQKRIQNNKTQ